MDGDCNSFSDFVAETFKAHCQQRLLFGDGFKSEKSDPFNSVRAELTSAREDC